MNNLIDFLMTFNDNNNSKALYVNPQDFGNFAVDLVFNSPIQKKYNRVLVMSLDELLFCFPEESSRKLEVHNFVNKELPNLI